jgi:hypothetical protein
VICFKGLEMDMRSLRFETFKNLSLIFAGILRGYAEAQKV